MHALNAVGHLSKAAPSLSQNMCVIKFNLLPLEHRAVSKSKSAVPNSGGSWGAVRATHEGALPLRILESDTASRCSRLD